MRPTRIKSKLNCSVDLFLCRILPSPNRKAATRMSSQTPASGWMTLVLSKHKREKISVQSRNML